MTGPIQPERLSPDPAVARAAWRFPAESPGPQAFHDVALMLGEPVECSRSADGSGEHVARRVGTRIVCALCLTTLRYWACDCQDAVYRERACKHVEAALRLYADERRIHSRRPS
jgi:hypothetical protein